MIRSSRIRIAGLACEAGIRGQHSLPRRWRCPGCNKLLCRGQVQQAGDQMAHDRHSEGRRQPIRRILRERKTVCREPLRFCQVYASSRLRYQEAGEAGIQEFVVAGSIRVLQGMLWSRELLICRGTTGEEVYEGLGSSVVGWVYRWVLAGASRCYKSLGYSEEGPPSHVITTDPSS
jgi:hypothetical protein